MSRTLGARSARCAAVDMITLVIVGGGAATVAAADIGGRIEPFTLPDIHGRDRSLDELADKPLVVVAFLGTECPLARLYAPRLARTERRLRGQGRRVCRHRREPARFALRHVGLRATITASSFRCSRTAIRAVADQFGAVRNPEVFVLDRQRTIRYRGRIDDQYGLGSSSGYAKHESQRVATSATALDELLAGKTSFSADHSGRWAARSAASPRPNRKAKSPTPSTSRP